MGTDTAFRQIWLSAPERSCAGERVNDQVDWENVIEEFESVGNERRFAAESPPTYIMCRPIIEAELPDRRQPRRDWCAYASPRDVLLRDAGAGFSIGRWCGTTTGENGRPRMRARTLPIVLVLLCLLSGLNAIALIVNLSQPSRAAVGGMSYQELMRDPDFTRAVKSIAQDCKVNVDIAKLVC
jgi:hypothetical protein